VPSCAPSNFLSSLPEPAVLVSADGIILMASKAFAVLCGKTLDACLDQNFCDFTTTSESQLLGYFKQCSRTTSPLLFAVDIKGRSGDVIPCRVYGALFAPGESRQSTRLWMRFNTYTAATQGFHSLNYRIAALNREIMARRAAELESEARQKELRFVMESMPQKVLTVTGEGRIEYLNQQWTDFTGLSFAEIRAGGWPLLVHHDDLLDYAGAWQSARASGNSFECEHRIRAKHGGYSWHLSRFVRFRQSLQQKGTWIGSSTDVNDQKLAEAALIRSEKLAAVGRLAATMAHEINNPLESITNLLYLARKEPGLSAAGQRNLSLADQELERVAQIARQTLGFYRENAGPISISVSDAIQDLLAVYGYKFRSQNISVEAQLDHSVRLLAAPGEFRQVFANLFVNAADAITRKDGRIRVRVRRTRDWMDPAREGVLISVGDNGSGISQPHRARIFEAFYTTKEDLGTGLGLWLTQSIVQKHGGRIRLRSTVRPGRSGTVFSIFWPERTDVIDNRA
jgi:PAS domain S-box-containing protein